MATLTKDLLKQKTAARFEWVEVEGFGRVGIRSYPQLQLSIRHSSYRDPSTGKVEPLEQAKSPIHQLIDQVMESETKPMFEDADYEWLAEADADALAPLYEAIERFNLDQKKVRGG